MPDQDEDTQENGDGESTLVNQAPVPDAESDGEPPNAIKRWLHMMHLRAPGVYQLAEHGGAASQAVADVESALETARAVVAGTQSLPADPSIATLVRELMQEAGAIRLSQTPVGFGHDVPFPENA